MSTQEIISVFSCNLNTLITCPSPKMRLCPPRKPIVWMVKVTSKNQYFAINYILWVKIN